MTIASISVSPAFAYDDYKPKIIGEGMKTEGRMGMFQMMMEHKSEGEKSEKSLKHSF